MKVKSAFRHILVLAYYAASKLLRAPVVKNNRGKTRILVFHHLDKPKRFEKMVAKIKEKYNLIGFDDYLQGKVSEDNLNVILAFDDGYESWLKSGLPIFQKLSLRPMLFINSDFIGLCERESFKYCTNCIKTWPEKSLSWEDVRTLHSAGCVIGGHGLKHTNLATDTTHDLKKLACVQDDKLLIERMILAPISVFAYPFGRWNDASVQILRASGYEFAFTSDSGYLDDSDSNFVLKRTNVGMRIPLVAFAYIEGWSEKLTSDVAKVRGLLRRN